MLDGYEIPLHRSLAEPILMAGAPRAAAIAIGTIAAALALGFRLWIPGLIVWMAGHSL
ncbi:VirB3 family type IV secretion system protein, partial [Hyphomonas sp.]